jgi:23S rRNA pseudouridine1911/1915/1917 synthase
MTYEDINIIFEDNHLLVVVKPQNVPCCEDESKDADLLNMLKEYLVKKYNKTGEAFLGLVHRLDRPTGGVMVFAKTSKAAARIADDMKEGEFEKKYLAVVVGTPREKQKELIHYLLKDEATNTAYTVPMATEGAKQAIMSYKVLDTDQGLSLADIKLTTGRSHQIRVQMTAIGTPLFGDHKYGGKQYRAGVNLALWATEIKFPHPVTKEKLVFRVFPPTDLEPWKYFDIPRFLNLSKASN